jgi:tetratricopeptide (TPR) repeat protein
MGIVLQRWQRYGQALDHYQQAFDLEHDNTVYLLAISEMLVATDKVDDAVKLLGDKVGYFDQNAAIRVALARLYTLKRDYDQAIKYYQQALLLKPDDKQVQEALMYAQLRGGQLDAALRTLEQLCHSKDGANRRDLQRLLGDTYLRAGRPGDARDVFLKLTQSEASDVEAWIKLGETSWALNDTGGALLAANRVMSLAPQSQEGFLLAGMVWQKRGRLDDALRLYDRAAALAPKSDDALVLRGMALAQAGRTTAATEAYNEALRRQPNDDRVKVLLTSVGTAQAAPKQ